MNTEFIEKKDRLTALIEREKLGGLLINAQHNFAWLTGGAFNGIDQSRENGAATLLIAATGKAYLLANNIELERMMTEQLAELSDIEPVGFTWQEEKADASIVIKTANELIGGEVASDIALHTSARAVEGLIAPCRFSLTVNEKERYKALGRDVAYAMHDTINSLEEGETEVEIEALLRNELAKNKISSVVTLVAADERISKYRHPVPTENRFNKTLLIVTCAKRGGLIISMSRMVNVGEPSDDLIIKTEAAAFVNASLLAATRKGITSRELYKIAADAYETAGFANEINLHHQGGATGYRTREWVAHPIGNDIVNEQQAFAWNPSITGTKVEDTVITSGDINHTIETITSIPEFPMIETTVSGEVYLSSGIVKI